MSGGASWMHSMIADRAHASRVPELRRVGDSMKQTGMFVAFLAAIFMAAPDVVQAQQPAPRTWTSLVNPPPVNLSNPLLLTDGTVIAHHACAPDWYKFTPDKNGSYINGTWSAIASLPSGYGPLSFGSAVLPDARVIIMGGEYNSTSGSCGSPVDTALGAIYDPVADVWTPVGAPSGWARIGDAAGIVLPNGTYMQTGNWHNTTLPSAALLNPVTLG